MAMCAGLARVRQPRAACVTVPTSHFGNARGRCSWMSLHWQSILAFASQCACRNTWRHILAPRQSSRSAFERTTKAVQPSLPQCDSHDDLQKCNNGAWACDEAGDRQGLDLLNGAGEENHALKSFDEPSKQSTQSEVVRFHVAPPIKTWDEKLKAVGCSIQNTLEWWGEPPLPKPVTTNACWLLPGSDGVAWYIAEHQDELRKLGWKVLSCAPDLSATLMNKAELGKHAASLGLSAMLPIFYTSPHHAQYPCILKPVEGTFGKDTAVVYSAEDVIHEIYRQELYHLENNIEFEHAYYASHGSQAGYEQSDVDEASERAELQSKIAGAVREFIIEKTHEDVLGDWWVLQEYQPGIFEYSTSLLVVNGKVLDAVCMQYEYDRAIYVWPRVKTVSNNVVDIPPKHLTIMQRLLGGYSGVCNFNYKLRPDGRMFIFEANPRIGGDLVDDVPQPLVKAMFEKLDAFDSDVDMNRIAEVEAAKN